MPSHMAAPEETSTQSLAVNEEGLDLPQTFVGALAAIAGLSIGASTYAALQAGYAAVGLGLLAAIALFIGTLAVFKTGRRLGTDIGR